MNGNIFYASIPTLPKTTLESRPDLWPSIREEAMEALKNLEEKWKFASTETILLTVCAVFLIVGICITVAMRKKKVRTQDVEADSMNRKVGEGPETGSAWSTVKKGLRYVCGCGTSNLGVGDNGNLQQQQLHTAAMAVVEREAGWWSGRNSSMSPLWQRRILMGERCELPRFSGLIMYDEGGRPLHPLRQSPKVVTQQEKAAPAEATTLRELL